MTPISLVPASADQRSVVANLIQLYLHDMTDFMPFPVGSDGRFEYGFLDRFWRYPYLITHADEIAGFALVVDECPLTGRAPCWFMAEFFLLRAYRGKGLATAAVNLALANHPGQWHIAVPHANPVAQAFWSKALTRQFVHSRNITFEDDAWLLNEFTVAA